MSLLDWLVVALVLLLAIRGFSAGFVSGAFSPAGSDSAPTWAAGWPGRS